VCRGIVTEGVERCPDRTAEVSRGRSSRLSDEGPNDRKGYSCLGLDEGTALAILLWQALGRHSAVKPQRMLTREVKPTRRPQTANAQPIDLSVGPTYRTAVCGPACTVVWQGRRGDSPPYADLRV
jgi:hypothetical protein